MKRSMFAMVVVVGTLLAVSQSKASIDGLPVSSGEDAEYVFGDSAGNDNFLKLGLLVGGTAILSTSASEFYSGSPESRNQGWWSATIGNNDSNDNYFVGNLAGDDRNDFFTFDISALTGNTVTNAVLSVKPRRVVSDLLQPYKTVSFFDVLTAAATLNANVGTSSTIFNDLGSGTNYGSFSFPVGYYADSYTDVSLNAAAVADINAAIGANAAFFSVGGTLSPTQIVPEPATLIVWSLLGTFAIGLGWWRRRKAA